MPRVSLQHEQEVRDRIVRAAVAGLFRSGQDPISIIRWKDIHEQLEEAALDRDLEQDQQEADEDRAAVADRDPDPAQPATGLGPADRLERRVVLRPEERKRRDQRVDLRTGQFTTLYDACDGKPLNSPNDLVYRSDGALYFIDWQNPGFRNTLLRLQESRLGRARKMVEKLSQDLARAPA